MHFSIVITTYQKKDGSTPKLLRKALDSVFNQDYKDFMIFIIGDKYENNDEFLEICKSYDQEKIYYENLPFAAERDKYDDKWLIWSYGGCYANNYGINKSIDMGFEYVCHLDHDDEWLPNHLSSIKYAIDRTNSLFICTKSQYTNGTILPTQNSDLELIPFIPRGGQLIHSSTCINFKKIPLRHRNIYEETGSLGSPGDFDMWERIGHYLKINKLEGCIVNKITCKHLDEGYERR
jgi:glycosyltransferase involved in cell wall biosynthesis